MAEAQGATIALPSDFNPFSDEPYVPSAAAPDAGQPPANTPPDSGQPPADAPPADTPPITFDPNAFVKEKFGFDSVEEAENFVKTSKEKAEKPFEFKDDNSRKIFDAIQEGKIDDIYNVLNQQKRIEKLTTGDVNPEIAVDIIKTDLQNKYKDLTSDEVDMLFYERYNFPRKPEQDLADTDEEYAEKVASWKSQVEFLEKRMVIDAKVIRPELEKLKTEFVLPDVYNRAAQDQEAQQRALELQQREQNSQQARIEYEKALDLQYNSFEGFNVTVKDEEVEIPVAFSVSQDERTQIKQELSDFDGVAYLENRWFTKEGKPNIIQAMSDKYILENFPKILQKVANESAAQMKLQLIKKQGNITVGNQTTPQGTPTKNPQEVNDQLANWAFGV